MATLEINIQDRAEHGKPTTTLDDLADGELFWLDDGDGSPSRVALYMKVWGDGRKSGAFNMLDMSDGQITGHA